MECADCGSTQDLIQCPDCGEYFCGQCYQGPCRDSEPAIMNYSFGEGLKNLPPGEYNVQITDAIMTEDGKAGIIRIEPCCENENRNINGGCDNCGDPCL